MKVCTKANNVLNRLMLLVCLYITLGVGPSPSGHRIQTRDTNWERGIVKKTTSSLHSTSKTKDGTGTVDVQL